MKGRGPRLPAFFDSARTSEALHPVNACSRLPIDVIRNPHLGKAFIHDVGAMLRTCEPSGNHPPRRLWTGRNVLADSPPSISCTCGPRPRIAPVSSLVCQTIVSAEIGDVAGRGFGEYG